MSYPISSFQKFSGLILLFVFLLLAISPKISTAQTVRGPLHLMDGNAIT